MAKITDYSGDYRNDFDLSNLSREALITLIGAFKKLYGGWLTYASKIIRGGLGDRATYEEFRAMLHDAGNETITKLAIPELKEALNLQEDDEAIQYKYYQICCEVEGLKKGYFGDSDKIQNFLSNYPKDFDFSGISQAQCVNVVRSFRRIYQGYRDIANPKYYEMYHQKGIVDQYLSTLNASFVDHTIEVWVPELKKAMNVGGDDVLSMFKLFQVAPDGIQKDTYDLKIEITDRYDVTYIGILCYTAAQYEEAEQWEELDALCAMGEGSFEHSWYYACMSVINPKMKMAWPVLPPRKSKDDIFCKFRFWVEEEDRTLRWKNGEGYIH